MHTVRWTRTVMALLVATTLILNSACAPTPATPASSGQAGQATQPGQAASGQTVRIGITGPFTGPTANLGALVKQASEMAAEEVNAAGGVNVGGQKMRIELFFGDTERKLEAAVAVTERLITQDKVHAIVGYVHSSMALAALEVSQRYKIPAIDTVATTIQIAQRIEEGNKVGETQYAFQLSPTSYDRGLSEAAAAHDLLGSKRLGAILQNTDLGRDLDKVMKEYFAEHTPDAEWVMVEFPDQNATEYYPELSKLKNANADVVFVSLSGAPTKAFTKQFVEIAPGAVPIFDGSEFAEPAFLTEFGDVAEGWLVNMVWSNEAPVTPKTADFVKKWSEKYGAAPGYIEAQQYEGVLTLVAAIEKAGSLEADAIQKALREIEFVGVTGIMKFNPTDHRVERELVIAQIQNKKHVVVWPLHAATGKFIPLTP